MPLSDADRDRVRYHLGYQSTSAAASVQLGIPRSTPTMFIVESAMDKLLDFAVPRVQRLLDRLDAIESRLEDSLDYLAAESIEGIRLRSTTPGESHPDALEREYLRWAQRLADVLGTYPNSCSPRFNRGGPRRAGNIRVSG
jgi:hypothetical protein